MRWRLGVLLLGVVLLLPHAAHADAQQTTNKGLFITPARAYTTVNPGSTAHGGITVANYTDHPQNITLYVDQFSVANYTYDYTFTPPKEDWVKLSLTQTSLQPGQNINITYTAAPPAHATIGGHYFAIFASAIPTDGSSKDQLRATTVMYITVNGALHLQSQIIKDSFPHFAFDDIDYTLDVKNTGNTHFFIYTAGGFNGMPRKKDTARAHLLLPGTVRQVSGTIAAPLLPGIYTATYGYLTENGQVVKRTAQVVYLPWWTALVVVGVVWIAIVLWRRFRRRRSQIFKDSSPRQYK